jgi:hypothetical protein
LSSPSARASRDVAVAATVTAEATANAIIVGLAERVKPDMQILPSFAGAMTVVRLGPRSIYFS